MPPVYTFLIILFIISIACVTRANLRTVKSDTGIAVSNHIVSEQSKNQTILKNQIVNLLMNNISIKEYQKKDNDNTYFVYTAFLKSYLNSDSMTLSDGTYEQIREKVNELIKIIKIEKECDFTKMSLDGRAVAIGIAKNIYELLGLKIDISMEGKIEQITEQSGRVIYIGRSTSSGYDIQIQALVIVFLIISVLLISITIYGKKKHLFKKEEKFNEFDEKRYA